MGYVEASLDLSLRTTYRQNSTTNQISVLLDLDVLQYVQHSDDWGNLVLPRGHRDMVQAMVESYTRRPDDSFLSHDQATERIDMDLVRGKGK